MALGRGFDIPEREVMRAGVVERLVAVRPNGQRAQALS